MTFLSSQVAGESGASFVVAAQLLSLKRFKSGNQNPMAQELFLALGTIMTTTPTYDESFDGRFADEARLSCPLVDIVTHLEEAFVAFGIDVIVHGRTA